MTEKIGELMLWKTVEPYLRSRVWALLTVFFGFLFTSAAWPGWMNGDSGTQWMEASGRFLVSDWHSPQMSWAWSFMNPDELGPRGPFLIQSIIYFTGLALIVHWTELRSTKAAMMVLVAAVVGPYTWNIGWLTKDAFIISFLSLSTGLFLSGTYLRRKIFWQIGSGFALGVSLIGRPYMAPVLLIWAFALVIMVIPPTRRSKILIVVIAPAIIVSSLGIFAYKSVLPPFPTFASSATAILDVARAECFSRPRETVTPLKGVIPRSLIVNGEMADVCASFTPNMWDDISYRAYQTAHIPLPKSGDEADLLREAWIKVLREYPSIIFTAKIESGVALLLTQSIYIPELKLSASIPGRIGTTSPDVKKFPSRGGVLLALLVAPAQLLVTALPFTQMPVFWIFLLPGLFLLRFKAQNPSRRRLKEGIFLFSVPSIWLSLFTLVTPALDSRYLIPGGFMGAIASLIFYLEFKKLKV